MGCRFRIRSIPRQAFNLIGESDLGLAFWGMDNMVLGGALHAV